jgi:hypothetical protein
MRSHPRGCVVVVVAAALGACVRVIVDSREAAYARAAMGAPLPAAPPLDPAGYRVAIEMTAETADALAASGYALLGFKAVRSSDRGGVPLVWFRTPRYSLSTTVTWFARYQAYTATRAAAPASIDARASYDIAPGQVLEVTSPAGTGVVLLGGPADAIALHNQTTVGFRCGISQYHDGAAAPIASFPLHGKSLQTIVPVERVLLVFATAPLASGTAVRTSPGLGVLVDLDGAHDRALRFDIDEGWSAGDRPWAREVPPGAELAPLLIIAPTP